MIAGHTEGETVSVTSTGHSPFIDMPTARPSASTINEPAGTACGDPSDTACDDPDTCDGAGSCAANEVACPAGVCNPQTGKCGPCPFDCDEDDDVDAGDFLAFLGNFGDLGGFGCSDGNQDGTVDSADFLAFLAAFGLCQ